MPEHQSVAEDIAHFCMQTHFANLPHEVVEKTKIHILDTIGAALAGSCREETMNLIHLAEEWAGNPESTLLTSTVRIPMVNAALVNAEMCHDTGLDDVYPSAALHPGAVVFPSALVASEKVGERGSSFITAVVLGYDMMLRIGENIGPKAIYGRGFHPTGVCGVFGSTVAVGKLLGLNQKKFVSALGIAGSQAGGLMEFLSDGSSVKRLHPARASQSGLLSVVLAEAGFTGPSTVIEGRNGFYKAYSEDLNCSELLAHLGKQFKIMQTGLKLYPCTRYIEPSLNIISDLQNQQKIDYREIKEITIHIFDAALPIVVEPLEEKRRPRNAFAGQFSLPYCVAAMIVRGRLTKEEYFPEVLQDREIGSLVEKIKILPDPGMSRSFPKLWPTRLVIETKTGKTLVGEVSTAKGDPQDFPPVNEVVKKFSTLAKPQFSQNRLDQIVETVMKLEKVRDMRLIGELLRKER